jgi:hypothetical protein
VKHGMQLVGFWQPVAQAGHTGLYAGLQGQRRARRKLGLPSTQILSGWKREPR